MIKELKEYLITEHPEGYNDLSAFLGKQEYMYQIMDILQHKTGCDRLSYGYGNYNASVCFLYDEKETEQKMVQKIRKVLEKLRVDPFSIYVTYILKSGEEDIDLQLLMNEISLVNPQLMYYFGKDRSILDKARNMYKAGKQWPLTYSILEDDLFNTDDPDVKKRVSAAFARMIAFKDILKR